MVPAEATPAHLLFPTGRAVHPAASRSPKPARHRPAPAYL